MGLDVSLCIYWQQPIDNDTLFQRTLRLGGTHVNNIKLIDYHNTTHAVNLSILSAVATHRVIPLTPPHRHYLHTTRLTHINHCTTSLNTCLWQTSFLSSWLQALPRWYCVFCSSTACAEGGAWTRMRDWYVSHSVSVVLCRSPALHITLYYIVSYMQGMI